MKATQFAYTASITIGSREYEIASATQWANEDRAAMDAAARESMERWIVAHRAEQAFRNPILATLHIADARIIRAPLVLGYSNQGIYGKPRVIQEQPNSIPSNKLTAQVPA